MNIWAHRGCSLHYPENTLTAFGEAVRLPGLTGIETDVQMTRDGYLVIIHDEKVDRTTDGAGMVKDLTLKELKKLSVKTKKGERPETIPTFDEALDFLAPYLKDGLKLNLELKNSKVLYPGMEEKALDLLASYGLEREVVYSSFYAKSLARVRRLLPEAEIGILDIKASDCLYKLKGECGANAIHPYAYAMDNEPGELAGLTVRAWLMEKLYPAKETGDDLDLDELEAAGITDLFMNEPERYLA